MSKFIEWFDAEKQKAESTECGKAFLAMGFEFWTTGGCLTAWRKALGNRECLASSNDSAIPGDPDSDWIVGIYVTFDGDIVSEVDCDCWQAAVSSIQDSFGV